MFSRINNSPNLKPISCASNYCPSARLFIMSPGVTEPEIQINEPESTAQLSRSTGSHRPHQVPSSNSTNAQCGTEKPEHCSQDATGGPNEHFDPARASCHTPKILPFCDESRGDGDLDPITPTAESHTTARDTSSHDPNTKVDDEKKAALSASMGPEPLATADPSEPAETKTMAANFQPVDDDPIYSIGKIKVYDQTQKEIPEIFVCRWQLICAVIFDRVWGRMKRGRFSVGLNKVRARPIIELWSAGATKASSMPAAVVVVPKHVKKMQNFLDTDIEVQNRCKPRDGTSVELLALACKGSITLTGMSGETVGDRMGFSSDSDSSHLSDDDDLSPANGSDSSAGLHSLIGVLDVDAQSVSVVREPSTIDTTTKHGMGIRVIIQDSSQNVRGTCGGFLQLTFRDSPPRQVGLIAGHLLEQLSQAVEEEEQQNVTQSSFIIGDIFHPKSLRHIPRYDWALFDVTEPSFEHNMVSHDGFSVAQESEIPGVSILVDIRTSRGEMTGTLSSSTSGIMLNPDQGFVHVRTITINKGELNLVSSLIAKAIHELSSAT